MILHFLLECLKQIKKCSHVISFFSHSDPNELRQSWLKLLNQQKVIHEAELEKWQGFVRAAANLLQKVKDIYTKFSVDLKNADETVKEEF